MSSRERQDSVSLSRDPGGAGLSQVSLCVSPVSMTLTTSPVYIFVISVTVIDLDIKPACFLPRFISRQVWISVQTLIRWVLFREGGQFPKRCPPNGLSPCRKRWSALGFSSAMAQ